MFHLRESPRGLRRCRVGAPAVKWRTGTSVGLRLAVKIRHEVEFAEAVLVVEEVGRDEPELEGISNRVWADASMVKNVLASLAERQRGVARRT